MKKGELTLDRLRALQVIRDARWKGRAGARVTVRTDAKYSFVYSGYATWLEANGFVKIEPDSRLLGVERATITDAGRRILEEGRPS